MCFPAPPDQHPFAPGKGQQPVNASDPHVDAFAEIFGDPPADYAVPVDWGRQHVMPEPKPSCFGRYSHWIPVCST
ncbi:hypothetical protein GCM10010255_65900 [Streptomyces coeruleofuscus]|uniref:Uncharacterized protein n=1 Tax=Streptomyces coeruleofuscus TaxID=66879 RepID=A0ABP5W5T7_9ACTN